MTARNLGYMFGLRGARQQSERQGQTGGEKFEAAQGGKRKPAQRLAGQAMGLNLREGTGMPQAFSLPAIGSAELRTPNLPQ
jgi:hypothetical protein